MTLFDGITFKHPVLRVNNRDHNIDFYKRLGFKLVVEENALAIFQLKIKRLVSSLKNRHIPVQEL